MSDNSQQDLALVHYTAKGKRDTSFGGATNGIVITPVTPTGVTSSNARASSLVVQPNGAIVEVGTATGPGGHADFVLARYNSDGTTDDSFSGAGYVLVDLGASRTAIRWLSSRTARSWRPAWSPRPSTGTGARQRGGLPRRE